MQLLQKYYRLYMRISSANRYQQLDLSLQNFPYPQNQEITQVSISFVQYIHIFVPIFYTKLYRFLV